MDFLSYFALLMLVFVILVLSYGIIAIHDIPYHIAKQRNHPHQDAIHAGGWVSLFTLHAIWPFLWLWATAYHPEHGYMGLPRKGVTSASGTGSTELADAQNQIAALQLKITELEAALAKSTPAKSE